MVVKVSLRFKLILFSLVITMLPIFFAYFLVQQNINLTRDQLHADSLTAAKSSRATVDNVFFNTKALLTTLGHFPQIGSRDQAAIRDFLQDTLATNPRLVELFVTDEQGNVTASAGSTGMSSSSISGWPEFSALANSQNASTTGRRVSSAGTSVSYVLVPFGQGTPGSGGVVGAAVSLEALQSELNSVLVNELITISLVDSQGVALVNPEQHQALTEYNSRQFLNAKAASRDEERTWMDNSFSDGKPWLRTYFFIESAGWGVIVSLPAGVGYPTLQVLILQQLLPLIFVSCLAVFCAIIIAQRLTEPLYELIVAASSMAKGELGKQVQISTGDEIEGLAAVFNYMSRTLQAHVNELTEAKAEITQKAGQLSELLARTFRSQEEERNRIAVDLHDDVTQLVVGALYEMQSAEKYVASAPEVALDRLQHVKELLNCTVEEMRAVIFNLHPSTLYYHGLVPAVNKYVDQFSRSSGVFCAVRIYGESVRLPVETEIAIYRIIQEAFNNVRRHSGADAAYVVLSFQPDSLRVTVQDNGTGFDKEALAAVPDDHLGLVAMRERAQSIGGQLEIRALPGEGSKIVLNLPLHSGNASSSEDQRLETRQAVVAAVGEEDCGSSSA